MGLAFNGLVTGTQSLQMMRLLHQAGGLVLLSLFVDSAFADGTVVDKIYDPYVNPLEKEVEYRYLDSEDSVGRDIAIHQLGFSWSPLDRLALEAYVSAEDAEGRKGDDSAPDAWELEARYQLTEQGEYAVDWGLVAEYEQERHDNNDEMTLSVVALKEWGRWLGVANAGVGYENRGRAKDEWETSLHLQTRYRFHPHLEPGLEFHAGEDYRGLGPVTMGTIRLPGARSLHWELAAVAGLDDASADLTLRFALECEFY